MCSNGQKGRTLVCTKATAGLVLTRSGQLWNRAKLFRCRFDMYIYEIGEAQTCIIVGVRCPINQIGIDWSFGGKNGNSAKAVRAEIFSIRNGGVEMIVGKVKPMGWVLFSGRRRPKHGYLRAETDISIIQWGRTDIGPRRPNLKRYRGQLTLSATWPTLWTCLTVILWVWLVCGYVCVMTVSAPGDCDVTRSLVKHGRGPHFLNKTIAAWPIFLQSRLAFID